MATVREQDAGARRIVAAGQPCLVHAAEHAAAARAAGVVAEPGALQVHDRRGRGGGLCGRDEVPVDPGAGPRPTARRRHVRETPGAVAPRPVHAVERVQHVARGVERAGGLRLVQRPELAAAVVRERAVAHARPVHVHHSFRRRCGSHCHGSCRTRSGG